MPPLAAMLTSLVDRPVIDRTGLKGAYQITLDLPFQSMFNVIQNIAGNGAFASGGFPGFPGGGFPGFGGPGNGGASPGAVSDPTASMFPTIQQLGLKLQPRKASVDTIVIDHLEKLPIEN